MTESNLTLEIQKLVYGGDGLAFHDGKPVFLPYVLPGETVEAFPVEEKRKLIRALPASVRRPAQGRIEPACPHFTQCGGCHYQHMGAEEQAQLKVDILAEQLRRLGKINWEDEIPVHSAEPWNYRNRVQLKLAPHPVLANVLQVGYYRAGSRSVWALGECPISSPKLNDLIEVLNRLSAEHRLPMNLQGIEAFADDRDESLWLTVSAPELDFELEPLTELLRTEVSGLLSLQYHDLTTHRRVTDGLGWNYWHVSGQRWRVSHQSFFQVNRHLMEKTLERVTAGLEGATALDLYAGVGLFTRALAEKFERVMAIENHGPAFADLAANVSDLEGVEIQKTGVTRYLESFPEKCGVVLLDPPRAGLGSQVTEALREYAPPRLVYLSCDPSTLARDLQELVAPGDSAYRIAEIEMLDFFPQTFHIETLVRLERGE